MICCGAKMTVLDSRNMRGGDVRRRRECESCGKRITTYEMPAPGFREGKPSIPSRYSLDSQLVLEICAYLGSRPGPNTTPLFERVLADLSHPPAKRRSCSTQEDTTKEKTTTTKSTETAQPDGLGSPDTEDG